MKTRQVGIQTSYSTGQFKYLPQTILPLSPLTDTQAPHVIFFFLLSPWREQHQSAVHGEQQHLARGRAAAAAACRLRARGLRAPLTMHPSRKLLAGRVLHVPSMATSTAVAGGSQVRRGLLLLPSVVAERRGVPVLRRSRCPCERAVHGDGQTRRPTTSTSPA